MGIITPRPEILWGIDAARYRTSFDGLVFILFVIEHCTGECLAIDVVAESEQGTASFPSAAPHARSAANLRRVEVPQSGWVGSVLGKDTVPWAAIQPPDFRAPLRTFGLPDSRSI